MQYIQNESLLYKRWKNWKEELELDLSTTDLKGLARFSQNFWDYLTSEELWDFIMFASIKIIALSFFHILSFL